MSNNTRQAFPPKNMRQAISKLQIFARDVGVQL